METHSVPELEQLVMIDGGHTPIIKSLSPANDPEIRRLRKILLIIHITCLVGLVSILFLLLNKIILKENTSIHFSNTTINNSYEQKIRKTNKKLSLDYRIKETVICSSTYKYNQTFKMHYSYCMNHFPRLFR